ncbi:hypothetical protein BKA70DRAFT_1231132 [Coprinopsis sp. MPI-PUGE-AT-0042]|nr:hypothetical protein BKA70DRAFT_1231132 [Coprinopsis sp. MPI-PUGE-AT-0042]
MAKPRQPVTTEAFPSTITIRPYKDADESRVIALFVDQSKEGVPGAPINDALRDHITSPPALLTYASTVVGVGLLWTRYAGTMESMFPLAKLASTKIPLLQRVKEAAFPVLAALVPLVSSLRFFLHRTVLRSSFTGYVTMSLGMDLKDIGAYYMGFDRSGSQGPQEMSNEVAMSRETILWVAEDIERGQLVGIIGLDSNLDKNPRTTELRRMVVALSHRRMGIAHKLTQTLVDHVKRLNERPGADHNKFTTIKLSTTSFQLNAMHMYGKHGWRKTGITLFTQKHQMLGGWIAPSYTLAIQQMELDLTR